MSAVIVRILLRYLAGALITKGLLSPEDGNMLTSDPDVAQLLEIGVGLGFGLASEAWYAIARRFGWAK